MRDKCIGPKSEVVVQAMITERQKAYLLRESRKRCCTFSDLVRAIIDNAIKDNEAGKIK